MLHLKGVGGARQSKTQSQIHVTRACVCPVLGGSVHCCGPWEWCSLELGNMVVLGPHYLPLLPQWEALPKGSGAPEKVRSRRAGPFWLSLSSFPKERPPTEGHSLAITPQIPGWLVGDGHRSSHCLLCSWVSRDTGIPFTCSAKASLGCSAALSPWGGITRDIPGC